ncbi:hypothetical protein C5E11_15965 [Clavibacter michiganensis]|nr:hypothetical protein C5E11_15965 [Clavibacter michiganensis]
MYVAFINFENAGPGSEAKSILEKGAAVLSPEYVSSVGWQSTECKETSSDCNDYRDDGITTEESVF